MGTFVFGGDLTAASTQAQHKRANSHTNPMQSSNERQAGQSATRLAAQRDCRAILAIPITDLEAD